MVIVGAFLLHKFLIDRYRVETDLVLGNGSLQTRDLSFHVSAIGMDLPGSCANWCKYMTSRSIPGLFNCTARIDGSGYDVLFRPTTSGLVPALFNISIVFPASRVAALVWRVDSELAGYSFGVRGSISAVDEDAVLYGSEPSVLQLFLQPTEIHNPHRLLSGIDNTVDVLRGYQAYFAEEQRGSTVNAMTFFTGDSSLGVKLTFVCSRPTSVSVYQIVEIDPTAVTLLSAISAFCGGLLVLFRGAKLLTEEVLLRFCGPQKLQPMKSSSKMTVVPTPQVQPQGVQHVPTSSNALLVQSASDLSTDAIPGQTVSGGDTLDELRRRNVA